MVDTLHFLSNDNDQKHTLFVDSVEDIDDFTPASHFNTTEEMASQKFNRLSLEDMKNKKVLGVTDPRTLKKMKQTREAQYRKLERKIDKKEKMDTIFDHITFQRNMMVFIRWDDSSVDFRQTSEGCKWQRWKTWCIQVELQEKAISPLFWSVIKTFLCVLCVHFYCFVGMTGIWKEVMIFTHYVQIREPIKSSVLFETLLLTYWCGILFIIKTNSLNFVFIFLCISILPFSLYFARSLSQNLTFNTWKKKRNETFYKVNSLVWLVLSI